MSGARLAFATGTDAVAVAEACVDQLGRAGAANLGFLYFSDTFAAEAADILAEARLRTGIEAWVGSIGTGILAGEREEQETPAVAALTLALPPDSFRVLPTMMLGYDDLPAVDRAWITERRPSFGVLHADPASPHLADLLDALAERSGAYLVGGLTSSHGVSRQIAGRVTSGGISGVLMAPEVTVSTGLSQGCTPLGETHTVTDTVDGVLVALDGRRALDVLKDDMGEVLSRDLRRVGGYVHAALPTLGSDTGDYGVRTLVGIDPARGWLAIGANLAPGDRLLFVRRDPAAARADLEHMADSVAGRLSGPAAGGLYFSCVARGSHMFGTAGAEPAILRARLGDVPVVGMSCAGEICNGRLYGYTGVLTLFS